MRTLPPSAHHNGGVVITATATKLSQSILVASSGSLLPSTVGVCLLLARMLEHRIRGLGVVEP
jgi:hypothetical protein